MNLQIEEKAGANMVDEHDRMLARLSSILNALHITNANALSHLALAVLNPAISVAETLKAFLIELEKGVFEDVMKSGSKEDNSGNDSTEFAFWERCEALTDPVRFRVWDVRRLFLLVLHVLILLWQAINSAMQKYSTVLQNRVALNQDCQKIRNQNNELKMLLSGYLASKVNDELVISPTKVMVARQAREAAI